MNSKDIQHWLYENFHDDHSHRCRRPAQFAAIRLIAISPDKLLGPM